MLRCVIKRNIFRSEGIEVNCILPVSAYFFFTMIQINKNEYKN